MTNIQSGYLKTKNGIQLMTTIPYPIGAIYLSIDNTNPSKLFGGVWEQIAQGRTLVGVDTSQTEFNKVKKTGGEKTHTLSIKEMPSHSHTFQGVNDGATTKYVAGEYPAKIYQDITPNWTGYYINSTGGSQAHNNLQPYYTCYIWLRTA